MGPQRNALAERLATQGGGSLMINPLANYNSFMDWANTPPAPLAPERGYELDRMTFLPFGVDQEGKGHLAMPGIIADSWDSLQRSLVNQLPMEADEAGNMRSPVPPNNLDAFNAASVAPMGSVGARIAGVVDSGDVGMFAGRMAKTADHNALARDVDALGYYSKALESARGLKQSKGTPEQMLAQLRNAGVKQAEIEATGIESAIAGRPSITRDEIVKHLEDNRVEVNEVVRAPHFTMGPGPSKWQSYSLDPSNPSYRETVLHLPRSDRLPTFNEWYSKTHVQDMPTSDPTRMQRLRDKYAVEAERLPAEGTFSSGHWSEPNVIAHARTSMVQTPEGKPVFHIDELQSDWGQKLRDNSPEKQASLKKQLDDRFADIPERWRYEPAMTVGSRNASAEVLGKLPPERFSELRRLQAELETAAGDNTPGHPLVNTTDQWVNTALRRMVRQAVDSDAEYIGIPSGDTVSAYGMGGQKTGIDYAYNEMYPKNLRNILSKIDPEAARAALAERLISNGTPIERSSGHTLFPITAAVRQKVQEGLPLFANPTESAAAPVALNALADAQPKGITAYHGSPHDFDKFDLSKIGTGEGAQAYGHGLYFAENEGVAKSYRDTLGGRDVRAYGQDVPFRGDSIPEDIFNMELHNSGDIDKAISALERSKLQYDFVPPEEFNAVLERANKLKAENAVETSSRGRMYEVRINANPEDFLDWDKPLSQQPKSVRDAIANAANGEVLPDWTGMEAFRSVGSQMFSEPDVMRPEIAKRVREAGIPGIRYLDGQSRGAGNGSSNYVLFDDALVEIMRKYANHPMGAAAPLATNALAQDQEPVDINALLRSLGYM